MLRFNNTDLHRVMMDAWNNRCDVLLCKDRGVYLMSERSRRDSAGYRQTLAYADGCHPERDARWDTVSHACAGKNELVIRLGIPRQTLERILCRMHVLQISLTETTIEVQVGPAVWVPVTDYRGHIDNLVAMAREHFIVCRKVSEQTNWYSMAIALLDKLAFVNCKRAKTQDHERFVSAYNLLFRRVALRVPAAALTIAVH